MSEDAVAAKVYLVPLDFSKSSLAALNHADRLAEENRSAQIIVLHVMTASGGHVPFYLRDKFFSDLESDAREKIYRLLRRKKFVGAASRIVVVSASDPARAIVRQARKSKAHMIIMGTESRSGLKRLVLGSVAERTLRYARCPVLIVGNEARSRRAPARKSGAGRKRVAPKSSNARLAPQRARQQI